MGATISKVLQVDDIQEGDIIIAVVGQTGVGKSTFINTAAGVDVLPVKHSLKPSPKDVRHVECSNPERYGRRRVVFVETPGFDSEQDEQEVERKLKKWLKVFSSNKAKISGILYFHRITDRGLTDPPSRHLVLLRSLCEASVGGIPNRVIMVTTMWGHLRSLEVGQEREAELQRYWDTLAKGSAPPKVRRFEDSFESAWSIIFALLGDEGPTSPERERAERAEREKVERVERERAEREKAERERAESERVKREEAERKEAEREEAESERKVEKDRVEWEKVEREKVEKDKVEREKAENEREKRAREKIEWERERAEWEREKAEWEREKAEREREKAEREKEERETEERETEEKEKVERKEEKEREGRQKAERERQLWERQVKEAQQKHYPMARQLLLDLTGTSTKKALESLQDESQPLVDFLSKVIDDIPDEKRTYTLRFMVKIAKSTQVYPRCLELKGVECDVTTAVDSGGSGCIYKGKLQDQPICVKAVRMFQKGAREEDIRALAGEIAISAHVSHPNIHPIYGVYLSNEVVPRICVVSPWMENGSLLSYLKAFPKTPRVPLLSDILSGLCHIHGQDIVHSDLKASNILVKPTGQAVLADLGSSRIQMASVGATITATADFSGTTNWMAPELLTKDTIQPPTRESDMWAFGCICYEVFTGNIPFEQYRIPGPLIRAFIKGSVNPVKPVAGSRPSPEIVGMIDSGVMRLMKRCWDYTPKSRPTADQAYSAITDLDVEDGRPPVVSELTMSERSQDSVMIDYQAVYRALERIRQDCHEPGEVEKAEILSCFPRVCRTLSDLFTCL